MTAPTFTPSREKRHRPRGYVENWRPQEKTRRLLAAVDLILDEYTDYLPLTVRQVFYRLVGRFGYPKTEAAYRNLCETMVMARRANSIPFSAIRDDGVVTYTDRHYADVDDFRREVREMAENYTRDKLAAQRFHVELWCEAAGMLPQLARVGHRYSVPAYSSSGFDSLTAKWNLAQRICAKGKPTLILHVGDFDPSGVAVFEAMAADVKEFVLADRRWLDVTVEFVRVALTAEQVALYGLPTAPAKASSHANGWGGRGTCQLEALAPDQLAALVDESIRDCLDLDRVHRDVLAERVERLELTRLLPSGGEA